MKITFEVEDMGNEFRVTSYGPEIPYESKVLPNSYQRDYYMSQKLNFFDMKVLDERRKNEKGR